MYRLMKFFKIQFIFIALFIPQIVSATIGCRIGNYILTTPTGGFFMNGNSKAPIYNYSPGSANTINKRNWNEDPQCGILRSVADKYSIASGGSSNPNSSCSPSNNYGDIGKLVYYNPADNSCKPTNVPLDDYAWVLLIALSGAGFMFLKNRSAIVS